MIANSILKLHNLCETIPALLRDISETDFSFKPQKDKWSKKEILGHLIDSATNNHHRFIRAQFEQIPVITYDQNKWNQYNYYEQIKAEQLIHFWTAYNLQLLELVKLIPETNLKSMCNTGRQIDVSIEWLFNDYVSHLEHHLEKIFI